MIYTEELYKPSQRIVVVVSKAWSDVSEDERNVLSKMLVAVKQSLAAVQVVNSREITLADLATFNPSKVLAFGATLEGQSKLYELITIDGVAAIVADSLEKLDDAKKKSLWVALKQMFGM